VSLFHFHGPPPPELALALADFERQFTYPLGPVRSFRIEHGEDYARFYRSQGTARCIVRVEQSRVIGVLCAAVRSLLLPDGADTPVAYIGDLKIAREARLGMTLLRLGQECKTWASAHCGRGFGVVMDGTTAVPSRYTGRAGIPAFDVVGRVLIYRLSCPKGASHSGDDFRAGEKDVRDNFARLSQGRFACPVGKPEQRSATDPLWLMLPDGSACGCLEDTRRAKRLIADDGQEMISAHLSSFAFASAESGARLLTEALALAAERGFPALFTAVDVADVPALEPLLPPVEVVRAPATVYGHGISAGQWIIHTSEI